MTDKKYYYRIDLIKRYLFLSFAFFLPINQRISTINIVLLVVFSLLNLRKSKINFKTEFIPLIVLYFIYCLSLLYSSELQLSIIEKKASLLFFPIIFTFNRNIVKYYELIFKYFVLGCLVALIICEINAFYNSFNFEHFYFDSRVDKSISFYNSLIQEKNLFFSYNFSFIHQTVYFAMYMLFAITILLYKKIFKSKTIQYFIISILIMGVFQTLNKAGFIVLLFLALTKIYSIISNKKIAVISSILFLFFGCLVFILNPRVQNLSKKKFFIDESKIIEKDFKKIKNTKPTDTDFRVMLWVSAIEMIKEHPVIGIGAGGSHNRLYEVFAVKRQWYYSIEKYHAHNQYLQILLDIGIIGFSVFVFLFIYFLRKVFRNYDNNLKLIAINFVLILTINFLFESMFERYSGISFFAFFYCLLFLVIQQRKGFKELQINVS
tara:strand:- start:8197 stop:9501 length:1305 start_codon:yes stop_codon:yes gene_type:complete